MVGLAQCRAIGVVRQANELPFASGRKALAGVGASAPPLRRQLDRAVQGGQENESDRRQMRAFRAKGGSRRRSRGGRRDQKARLAAVRAAAASRLKRSGRPVTPW